MGLCKIHVVCDWMTQVAIIFQRYVSYAHPAKKNNYYFILYYAYYLVQSIFSSSRFIKGESITLSLIFILFFILFLLCNFFTQLLYLIPYHLLLYVPISLVEIPFFLCKIHETLVVIVYNYNKKISFFSNETITFDKPCTVIFSYYFPYISKFSNFSIGILSSTYNGFPVVSSSKPPYPRES